MKKEVAIRQNLDLLNEFMKYAFENPNVFEGIPPEAELIILPTNDRELYEYNRRTAKKIVSQGGKVIFVEMKKPKITIPKLKLVSASHF